jgi:hypothetical protein
VKWLAITLAINTSRRKTMAIYREATRPTVGAKRNGADQRARNRQEQAGNGKPEYLAKPGVAQLRDPLQVAIDRLKAVTAKLPLPGALSIVVDGHIKGGVEGLLDRYGEGVTALNAVDALLKDCRVASRRERSERKAAQRRAQRRAVAVEEKRQPLRHNPFMGLGNIGGNAALAANPFPPKGGVRGRSINFLNKHGGKQ